MRDRLRREPRRNFRPGMLAQLEKDFHYTLANPFRVSCRSELTKDSLRVEEVGISSFVVTDMTHWDLPANEPGLVLAHGVLRVEKGFVGFAARRTFTVSLHCLARRIQRCPALASDDDLIDDVALAKDVDPDDLPIGKYFTLSTPTGRWSGRAIRLEDDNDKRILAARTWLNTE